MSPHERFITKILKNCAPIKNRNTEKLPVAQKKRVFTTRDELEVASWVWDKLLFVQRMHIICIYLTLEVSVVT